MKNIILIIIGFVFLIASLFIGNPFDFLNSTVDRISVFVLMVLILIIFIGLYRLIRKIENKAIRYVTYGLLSSIAIPYLIIGLWTMLLVTSSCYAMWQDVSVYTNEEGETVISQWRETSGSIYDFRDRKIITELGQLRISIDCDIKSLKGKWNQYLIEKDSTILVDFDK